MPSSRKLLIVRLAVAVAAVLASLRGLSLYFTINDISNQLRVVIVEQPSSPPGGNLVKETITGKNLPLKLLRLDDASGDLLSGFNVSAAAMLANGFPVQSSCDGDFRSLSNGNNATDDNNHKGILPPLQLIFMGGSATAMRPKNCEEGRYTDILQELLDQDYNQNSSASARRIETRNLAHGSTDSLWSALVLDEMVDPYTTDVLVWEFAINDALGGSTFGSPRTEKNLREMMDLWLWRVVQHFESVTQPVPPIILLYLWDSTGIQDGIVLQRAYEAQLAVVKHYQCAGLHISVVNVGGAVNGTNVAQSGANLLDDYHHPNCEASHLIAAMLRHALYHDIIPCHYNQHSARGNKGGEILHSLSPFTNILDLKDQAVLSAMLQRVEIGSLMKWQPQNGTSKLAIGDETNLKTEAMHGSKTSATRSDRKISYKLKVCPQMTSFLLPEPQLEWLGIGLGSKGRKRVPFSGQTQVRINGNTASLANDTYHWKWIQRKSHLSTIGCVLLMLPPRLPSTKSRFAEKRRVTDS